MYTVYVLQSKSTGRLYTGQTSDLPRRLREHNSGISRYCRGRGPWELVYTEACPTRVSAMAREKVLKSGRGRQFLKKTMDGRAGPPQAD